MYDADQQERPDVEGLRFILRLVPPFLSLLLVSLFLFASDGPGSRRPRSSLYIKHKVLAAVIPEADLGVSSLVCVV